MPKGYHHLTRDQRSQIFVLKAINLPQISIAEKLGVHRSTISRELRRNKGKRIYQYAQADKLSIQRRQHASTRPRRMTPEIVARIKMDLEKKWSPEQISGRLRLEKKYISHERIYQHIWDDKKAGGTLYKHLRHAGKKYNKRSSGKAGRGCIPNRVDIKNRPAIVEEKSRIGDWEGDLIIGAEHQGALLTYVDRHSKFTKMAKLPNKTAEEVFVATENTLGKLAYFVKTITYDNGKEFAMHLDVSKSLQAQCFFATPYHSWERGLNEHTNGLIRQYFPKKSNLLMLSNKEVQRVEDALNDRPRKVLGYKTPREVFLASQAGSFVALQA